MVLLGLLLWDSESETLFKASGQSADKSLSHHRWNLGRQSKMHVSFVTRHSEPWHLRAIDLSTLGWLKVARRIFTQWKITRGTRATFRGQLFGGQKSVGKFSCWQLSGGLKSCVQLSINPTLRSSRRKDPCHLNTSLDTVRILPKETIGEASRLSLGALKLCPLQKPYLAGAGRQQWQLSLLD